MTTPTTLLSADWSKDPRKRAVYQAHVPSRSVRRLAPRAWGLADLLEVAAAADGPVVVALDLVLGLPAGYLRAARETTLWRDATTFLEWLAAPGSVPRLWEAVPTAAAWDVHSPFFRVPPGAGSLKAYAEAAGFDLLRAIDRPTGAKPTFAVSGIPGTVGSGTRALWQELRPLLVQGRDFGVWPFDGALGPLLGRHGVVLVEGYPGIAYTAALSPELPDQQLLVAKTQAPARAAVLARLRTAPWVSGNGVELHDLGPAQASEDDFDALLMAAAALRCVLEGRPLVDEAKADARAEGGMLLSPAVQLDRPRTRFPRGNRLQGSRRRRQRMGGDLAGPGVSTYEEVARILPSDYRPLQTPLDRVKALYEAKEYIEKQLCAGLDLQMVPVPLIVTRESGVNDMLDRDGSRTPVSFPCGLGLEERLHAEVVQAATKWKRMALAQFGCAPGQGICTDMRAIRKDYFLDHDHSAYVDQWDWERALTAEQRTLHTLKSTVRTIWDVLRGAAELLYRRYPVLATGPRLPDEIVFVHVEELLERWPDKPRKERETLILQEHPAVFLVGIGHPLADGQPHELRAADYDDWITDTSEQTGRDTHGLNGDILVWNPTTRRRHELSSMGVRVTPDSLVAQMELAGQSEDLALPYHQAILNDRVPLSIGGGIGQSRTFMVLLRTAHIGEVSVSVWPDALKRICAERNIHVLE